MAAPEAIHGFSGQTPASSRQNWWLLTALDAHGRRFARAFHRQPDWVIITRVSDGRVVEANHGFQMIVSYAPGVVGKRMSEFNVWVDLQQRAELVQTLKMQSGFAASAGATTSA